MSSIDPKQLFAKVNQLIEKADMPERHTFFQLKNFIVGKEVTVQGQLWQIVRELRSRSETLTGLQDQIADTQDTIALFNIGVERLRLAQEGDELDSQERAIRVRKIERERTSSERLLESLQKRSKYLLEEMAYLYNAYETLNKVQEMKPLDDVKAQQEYWNEKFSEELNLRLLLRSPLDSDFVKTVLALDDGAEVKKQMTAILGKIQQNMIADRDRQLALASDTQTSAHRALLKKQGGK